MKKVTCFEGHTKRVCPICKCENKISEELVRNDKRGYGLKLSYKVIVSDCAKCGIYYQAPKLPDDFLNSVYSNYVGGKRAQKKRYKSALIVRENSALSFSKHIQNSESFSILEIGSSSGYNLENIRKHFDKVSLIGVDIDEDSVNFGIKMGNNLKATDAFKLDQKFNIVFMNHVLEHLTLPVEFVSEAKNLLKKDGKIIVNVPNSFEWKHKNNVREVPSFEHLNYFSEEGISNLFKKAGFKILSIETKIIHEKLHPVPEIRVVASL